jgi:hypothetical protein
MNNGDREVLRSFDGQILRTISEAYATNPCQSWGDFLTRVNQLVSDGLLVGKGDGFAVHFFLTEKARSALRQSA